MNSPLDTQKSALRSVSERVVQAGQNADLELFMRAQNTLYMLNNPFGVDGNEEAHIWSEITAFKHHLNRILEQQDGDVQMAGRRKRRRGKKTKKSRKVRRTTRRK